MLTRSGLFSSSRTARARSVRPRLEVLESRDLLSVCWVDRLTDVGEGKDFVGDLRYCIGQAQDKDSIQFAVKGTVNLTRALPDLTRSISIEGPGADLLTVRRDSGGDYRIFAVAVGATVLISGLTIADGTAAGPEGGGGILNNGTLTVRDSLVTGNATTESSGGGIFNSGTLTVSRSTFSANRSHFVGGGIFNNNRTLTITDSIFSGNLGAGGGGISSLGRDAVVNISFSTITGNVGRFGGGIRNDFSSLVVSYSTVSGNSADDGDGGGIATQGAGENAATVSNSAIYGNSARGGGGIHNFDGRLTVVNSTVTDNTVQNPMAAGGIGNGSSINTTSVVLLSSTVSDNTGSQIVCTRGFMSPTVVELRNTIVSSGGARPNFLTSNGSQIISRGHNLSSDDTGNLDGSGDQQNTDPLLGPLQDNGGPTPTRALLSGSPALPPGDPTDAPEWDQRGEGYYRIAGKTIDIGAFEKQDGEGRSPDPDRAFAAAVAAALRRRADPFGGPPLTGDWQSAGWRGW